MCVDGVRSKTGSVRSRAWRTALAGVIATALVAVLPWAARSSAQSMSDSDQSATEALLTAGYRYQQALLVDAPAARAALESTASSIGVECKGVLNGTAGEGLRGSPSSSFARRLGEEQREGEQLYELEEELGVAERLTVEQVYRGAKSALVDEIRGLRWSNANITLKVQELVAELEREMTRQIPNACADMKVWVASGYETLAPVTKELRAEGEANSKAALRVERQPSLAKLLKRYEGPPEKTLIARTRQVGKEVSRVFQGSEAVTLAAYAALGGRASEMAAQIEKAKAKPPSREKPVKRTETKNSLKYLRGGIRWLAHGRAPGGPEFKIKGEAFRYLQRIHFALQVEIVEGGARGESLSGRRPSVLFDAIYRGCEPHQYDIVYGLLKRPRDRVFARIDGALRPLSRAAIPRHLHADGVVVYAAYSRVPSELVVRDPSGKTIVRENLTRLGREATETCEGEAEGPESSPAG
jgi:hypothetical protein